MHTQYEKEKYTKTWDAKLNNLHEMKLHIKEYSYRDAKYKFEWMWFIWIPGNRQRWTGHTLINLWNLRLVRKIGDIGDHIQNEHKNKIV